MIHALLSYSCNFGIRGILATIREKIKGMIEQERFREYLADCLWSIAKNTAQSYGGTFFEKRFADGCKEEKPQDNRTGDEIVQDVIRRAGLEVIG